MYTFGTIQSSDHTIEKYNIYADITWQLISSSNGMEIIQPVNIEELSGSVDISVGTANTDNEEVNINTGVFQTILHRSVKHYFYENTLFSKISGSSVLADDIYVVSIGQNLYGTRVKPGSFVLGISGSAQTITDDTYGNLIVNGQTIVGNIFYDFGIAVITHATSSVNTSINTNGLKIVSGGIVTVDYASDYELEQHQINVRVKPNQFNFSPFNPTIKRTYISTGSASSSFSIQNIPTVGENTWALYNLMGSGIIKPYITTIGLYNEQYELLAVAKLSTPIQRTFDTEQIFIIRFDTE